MILRDSFQPQLLWDSVKLYYKLLFFSGSWISYKQMEKTKDCPAQYQYSVVTYGHTDFLDNFQENIFI